MLKRRRDFKRMSPKQWNCNAALTLVKSLPKSLDIKMAARTTKVNLAVSIFLLISLLNPSEASSENILSLIRGKHERTGQCRLQCIQELANVPRDSDCERNLHCKSCWDLCPEMASQKSFFETFCAEAEPFCDRGCKTACNFFEEGGSQKGRESKEFSTPHTQVELRTNFVGCTLYWKTSGNDDDVYLHQLYGMDEQETWFDIGQTVESFHTLSPEEAVRAIKIRLLSISKEDGTVAEAETSFQSHGCKEVKAPETSTVQIQTGFLLQNSTLEADQPEVVTHPSSVLVVTSSILLTLFILMIAFLVLTRKDSLLRFLKQRNNRKMPEVPEITQEQNNYRISSYLQALEQKERRSVPVIQGGPSENLGFYV